MIANLGRASIKKIMETCPLSSDPFPPPRSIPLGDKKDEKSCFSFKKKKIDFFSGRGVDPPPCLLKSRVFMIPSHILYPLYRFIPFLREQREKLLCRGHTHVPKGGGGSELGICPLYIFTCFLIYARHAVCMNVHKYLTYSVKVEDC